RDPRSNLWRISAGVARPKALRRAWSLTLSATPFADSGRTTLRPTHDNMIVERRRILGGFAVFALVLLRLVIGWHFFGEGTKKLKYDQQDGFHLAFSADDFLAVAKGPLADRYYDYMPAEHGWRKL